MNNKYILFSVVAILTAFLPCAAEDEDVNGFIRLGPLYLHFHSEASSDVLFDGQTPLDDKSFDDRYGLFIRQPEWGRERFFREVDALVSNGCSRIGITSNVYDVAVIGVAMECLGNADFPEWIRCVDWLLTNGVDSCAAELGMLYVKRHGLSVDAFGRYQQVVLATNMISKAKREAVMTGLEAKEKSLLDDQRTAVVSNGIVRVFVSAGDTDPVKFKSFDSLLCKYWQGYELSSNRYENILKARDPVVNGQQIEMMESWSNRCNALLRELEKHQPLPLLSTNTINGVTW